MAITADFFKQYIAMYNPSISEHEQIMQYTVNLVAFNGLETNATTSMFVQINKPPAFGSCSVDPLQGVAMTDKFFIECWDWADPEEIGLR